MGNRQSKNRAACKEIGAEKAEKMRSQWYLHTEDFFVGLREEKKLFLSRSKERHIKKNDFIFFDGEVAESVFYIQDGEVGIFYATTLGKESLVFIRHAGDMFGLAEAMSGEKRACNARTINACCLYEIQRKDLEKLLSQNWTLSRRVIEILGSRLRFLGDQLENVMWNDVATRLLKLLFYMSHQEISEDYLRCGPIIIPLKLTQEQIAAMIGSCQQTISEILKQLEVDNVIRMSANRREITVNPDKISQYLL